MTHRWFSWCASGSFVHIILLIFAQVYDINKQNCHLLIFFSVTLTDLHPSPCRLEAELEKLQNSSRSADTTLYSTPCWNTASPWENNGTALKLYGLCICLTNGVFPILLIHCTFLKCGKLNRKPQESQMSREVINELLQLVSSPDPSVSLWRLVHFLFPLFSSNHLGSSLLSLLLSFSGLGFATKSSSYVVFLPCREQKGGAAGTERWRTEPGTPCPSKYQRVCCVSENWLIQD